MDPRTVSGHFLINSKCAKCSAKNSMTKCSWALRLPFLSTGCWYYFYLYYFSFFRILGDPISLKSLGWNNFPLQTQVCHIWVLKVTWEIPYRNPYPCPSNQYISVGHLDPGEQAGLSLRWALGYGRTFHESKIRNLSLSDVQEAVLFPTAPLVAFGFTTPCF